MAPPRTALTVRASGGRTDALSYDDTTFRRWPDIWRGLHTAGTRRVDQARVRDPARLAGVKTLGVDEHIWRPSRIGVDRAVTIMVDLTRDQAGCLHARLLDAVVGRSGTVYKSWLDAQPEGFTDGVETAALDPFRGYANAIRDGLPDAVAVLDAFHVVRLGTQVVDEVRRRVQQDTLGRRGHKDDPLYKIRGLLRHGVEHLTERQQAKISHCLNAGDPADEVNGLAVLQHHALLPIHPGQRPGDPCKVPKLPAARSPMSPARPALVPGAPSAVLLRHPRVSTRHRSP